MAVLVFADILIIYKGSENLAMRISSKWGSYQIFEVVVNDVARLLRGMRIR